MPTTTMERTKGTGALLVDVRGRVLPLQATRLDAHAGGGIARTRLVQTFENPYAEPLRVTYSLPLPADGAVAGFAFTLAGVRTDGIVQRKAEARAAFENALLEGRAAALLEEERSSVFTQELGNVPPGATVEVEVSVDQPLAWLPDGAWEWRFPTVIGPRYMGGEGRVPDVDRVTVPVATGGDVDARARLCLTIDDAITAATAAPTSPSHALIAREGGWRFADDAGARLDRDIVVRWQVAAESPGATVRATRFEPAEGSDAAYGLLTIVPPQVRDRSVARDLILLIDVSGSMGGEPLAQAKAVLTAMVRSLAASDQLEMLAFDSTVMRYARRPLAMTERNRQDALRWIAALEAGGCTEMREGIREAMKPLRSGAQRQVVLVTDGYIGFEAEIVEDVATRLPAGCRVHTLGVGSAVNRSLTRPVARAGAGRELIVAPGEDAGDLAARLLAVTAAPQLVDLTIGGSAVREVAQARIPDLYAGAPALIALSLDPAGGTVELRGFSAAGPWSQSIDVAPIAAGEGSAACGTLFARERVADLEARRHARGADLAELDASVEALGLRFQIATRCTSWVAVRDGVVVDPEQPTRSEVMPHMLPAGVSARGLGLMSAMAGACLDLDDECAAPAAAPPRARVARALPPAAAMPKKLGLWRSLFGGREDRGRRLIALEGRVVLDEPRKLAIVIELVVAAWSGGARPQMVDWRRPARVTVVLNDGSILSEVEVLSGTGDGRYRAGQSLRLVLALPDDHTGREVARVEFADTVITLR